MIISFFEEFHTPKDMLALYYVDWPTKVYIAASSVAEFRQIEKSIPNSNVIELIYWPVLSKKEGYWISPFSSREALRRVFGELKGNADVSVMIDAEFPWHQNRWLYLTQLVNFFRNRRLIRSFVAENRPYVAEYSPQSRTKELLLSFLGLHFDPKRYKNKVIRMMYHSMHTFSMDTISQRLESGVNDFGDDFLVGYGTIAHGVLGTEPMLDYDTLSEDLKAAQKAGVSEVVIFRLGGLDKRYARILRSYSC